MTSRRIHTYVGLWRSALVLGELLPWEFNVTRVTLLLHTWERWTRGAAEAWWHAADWNQVTVKTRGRRGDSHWLRRQTPPNVLSLQTTDVYDHSAAWRTQQHLRNMKKKTAGHHHHMSSARTWTGDIDGRDAAHAVGVEIRLWNFPLRCFIKGNYTYCH